MSCNIDTENEAKLTDLNEDQDRDLSIFRDQPHPASVLVVHRQRH